MKPENLATIFFIILGIILGYASFLLKDNLIAAGLAFVSFFVGSFILKLLLKDLSSKGLKWYFTNGGWIYFFIWFIVWVLFYNL